MDRSRYLHTILIGAAGAAVLGVAPVVARTLVTSAPVQRFEYADHAHRAPVTSPLRRARVARIEAAAALRRHGARAFDKGAAATSGVWSAPSPMRVSGINAILLPTGRVLFFGNVPSFSNTNQADAWTWNPQDLSWRHVPPPIDPATGMPANVWCAGHTFLPDGRLVVAGGNLRYPVGNADPTAGNGWKGLDQIYTFDPFTETWTRQPDMRHGRWYPTLQTLSDGRVVILGGLDESGHETRNGDLDIFTPSPGMNGVGTLAPNPPAARITQIYPHIFTLPNDRIVLGGPNAWDSAVLDTSTGKWTSLPAIPRDRLWGAAVMEPYDAASGPQAITLIGGVALNEETTADPLVYRLDLSRTSAGWKAMPSLAAGRAHLNATFLTDGSLMAVGGGAGVAPPGTPGGQYVGPVYSAERRNADGTWTTLPSQAVRRTYHSTALVLPDGRLLSTGDDMDGVIRPMELYSPAYLFGGARPQIGWAPTDVAYGRSFAVDTAQAESVDRVLLMAPSSVTHATDMNQRVVRLAFTASGGRLTVSAPPSRAQVPAGYYMLVVVNADGVPSVAQWARIGAATTTPPPTPPDPPGGTTTTTDTPPTGAPAGTPPATPVGTPPPVPAPPPAAPAVATVRRPTPTRMHRAPGASPLRTFAWVRRGRAHAARARTTAPGVLRIRVDTPTVHRVFCRRVLRRPAATTCVIRARLHPGDRVIATFRARTGEWSRIITPRAATPGR